MGDFLKGKPVSGIFVNLANWKMVEWGVHVVMMVEKVCWFFGQHLSTPLIAHQTPPEV